MEEFARFYAVQPYLIWLSVACLFLAVEIATGSGWLLWPAGSAGLLALLTLVVRLGAPVEVATFALLTVAGVLAARRLLPRRTFAPGPDINDSSARLLGRQGETAVAFVGGEGRVFVDGKEWAAHLQDATVLERGAKVQVTAVGDGAYLTVRAL